MAGPEAHTKAATGGQARAKLALLMCHVPGTTTASGRSHQIATGCSGHMT